MQYDFVSWVVNKLISASVDLFMCGGRITVIMSAFQAEDEVSTTFRHLIGTTPKGVQ